jgi:hypothetical protein
MGFADLFEGDGFGISAPVTMKEVEDETTAFIHIGLVSASPANYAMPRAHIASYPGSQFTEMPSISNPWTILS